MLVTNIIGDNILSPIIAKIKLIFDDYCNLYLSD